MNVLFLNMTDAEGGAARAAYRLLGGVRDAGATARMRVQRKTLPDPWILPPPSDLGKFVALLRPHVEQALLNRFVKPQGIFFANLLPERMGAEIHRLNPDLVHLHWISGSFIRPETLAKIGKPLVWTLHDSWAFTGGCHIPGNCTRYIGSCGCCPILGSSSESDLSRRVWRRKNSAWQNLDLTVVAPSRWLAENARSSSLFRNTRIEMIPNPLDLGRYRPFDKAFARDVLMLPQDRKLILAGAMHITKDPNKGFHLLREALTKVCRELKDVDLVVAGAVTGDGVEGMTTHYLGQLSDEATMALAYAAADVTALPSLQENLPNTLVESIACGTPCVAFRQGGVPDVIVHRENGFLADPFDPGSFAQGIMWILENEERRLALGACGRRKAEAAFEANSIASRYFTLYRELLGT